MLPYYGLYAYGVVGKVPEQLDIVGIDKKNSVYPVTMREICAIVSGVDIDQFQSQIKHLLSTLTKATEIARCRTRDMLQAHEDVLDALIQDTTVVPLKFGTILRDEEAALEMLRDGEEKFKNLLVKFTQRIEWGVKVYANKQALMRHIVQLSPRFTGMQEQREKLPRGRAYLLGRKLEEDVKHCADARLIQIAEEVFQGLAKGTYEAKIRNSTAQKAIEKEMILNAAYLIDKEKVACWRGQGKKLMEEYAFLGLELEFSGPWPPYNFT